MDLYERYWDVSEKKVAIHYWNSKFLGRTCSDDLVKAFGDGLNELYLTKLIQISRDGPNANLKFLSKIKNFRVRDEIASLIDISSNNLHVIHRAFKTCSESSN